ncbi:V-type proton ATPase subunit C [Trifolium repens]|nr:V-type proton ATPase subunit C [Trifolium repens]
MNFVKALKHSAADEGYVKGPRTYLVTDDMVIGPSSPISAQLLINRLQITVDDVKEKVPRSSKKLYEDNEYALYTVTLFNRVADNFRTSAREKNFQACVLAPSVKAEKKVRSILEGLSDSSNSAYWKTDEDVGAGMAGLAGDADTHPYVSFTINLL